MFISQCRPIYGTRQSLQTITFVFVGTLIVGRCGVLARQVAVTPPSQTVTVGHDAELRCLPSEELSDQTVDWRFRSPGATSEHELTYHGRPVNGFAHKYLLRRGQDDQHVIRIVGVQRNDSGTYGCTEDFGFGETAYATLLVSEPAAVGFLEDSPRFNQDSSGSNDTDNKPGAVGQSTSHPKLLDDATLPTTAAACYIVPAVAVSLFALIVLTTVVIVLLFYRTRRRNLRKQKLNAESQPPLINKQPDALSGKSTLA